ncbi:MAG: cysteine synthase A [Mesoaciditoga sp.]|nr:MAG: cysteine synthase A [Mesoaciditoga sp.]PMP80495.1 MAG: cysteine synthase A [Mesoaciditoga sp.]HEU23667.1 cysteine synthase A [Mesoaciditoga lauensis]
MVNLISIIGKTPIVHLKTMNLWLKLEMANPGGSIKDRTAFSMINDALRSGLIDTGSTIVEPTSGNTGIGLAMVGSYYGLRVILTMPENLTIERRKLLQMYGADLVLTPANLGMNGSVEKAYEIAKQLKGIVLNQFENPANPMIHFMTTGPEILSQMNYEIDAVVAGVGTGGTISGIGNFMKRFSKKIKIVAVEPSESSVLSGGKPSPHGIQGIGAGFIPKNYDPGAVDEIISISTDEARDMTDYLSKKEGLFLGISSGATVAAGLKLSKKLEGNSRIVVISADGGGKYLSIW